MHSFHLHSCCSNLLGPCPTCTSAAFQLGFPGLNKFPGFTQQKHQRIFQTNHSACDVIVRNSLQEFQNGANGITMRSHENGLSTLQCWSNGLLPKWHHSSLSFEPAETQWVSESNEFLMMFSLICQVDHGFEHWTASKPFFWSLQSDKWRWCLWGTQSSGCLLCWEQHTSRGHAMLHRNYTPEN